MPRADQLGRAAVQNTYDFLGYVYDVRYSYRRIFDKTEWAVISSRKSGVVSADAEINYLNPTLLFTLLQSSLRINS